MIRTLHVDTGLTWRGGQRQVLSLTEGLRDRGYTGLLLCEPGSPLAEAAQVAKLSWQPLRSRGINLVTAPALIHAKARAIGATIIHAHDSRAHGLCQASRVLSQGVARPALVVHRRVDFPVGRSVGANWKYRQRDTQWIAVSEAVATVLNRGGVRREQISVVRSVVTRPTPSVDRATVRRRLGVGEDDILVGAIGHLAAHKAHWVLVEAVAGVEPPSRIRVVIAGEGEMRRSLSRQVRDRRLDGRVSFLGFRRDIADILNALDVLAHPSVEEGLGTVILDALALGVPVMASRAGGIPEALGGGEYGMLLPSADVPAWSSALNALPDLLPKLRDQAAGAPVGSNDDREAVVNAVLDVYHRAVNRDASMAEIQS